MPQKIRIIVGPGFSGGLFNMQALDNIHEWEIEVKEIQIDMYIVCS